GLRRGSERAECTPGSLAVGWFVPDSPDRDSSGTATTERSIGNRRPRARSAPGRLGNRLAVDGTRGHRSLRLPLAVAGLAKSSAGHHPDEVRILREFGDVT